MANIAETTWKLQLFKNNVATTVWEKHNTADNVLTATIPAGTFIKGNKYILSVMTNLDTIPLFTSISTGIEQGLDNAGLAYALDDTTMGTSELVTADW
jgi:hypothetical protein